MNPVKAIGLIVRLAVCELLLAEAVIVAVTLVAPCCDVATVNVALEAPAGTVTLETVADVELEAKVTTNPPVGALAVSATVPVLE